MFCAPTAKSDPLGQIAECLSLLVSRVLTDCAECNDEVHRKLDGAMQELRLLREVIAGRIAANDPRTESLYRIDLALADLAAAIELLTSRSNVSLEYSNAETASQMARFGHIVHAAARRAALIAGFAIAGGGLLGLSAPAFATDSTTPTYVGMTSQDESVMGRARPEYDAKGIPMGGFRLFPSLNANATYDDNVFRLPAASSDWYFEETPALRLVSQWGRHFFEIYGGVDNYNYSSFSRLDLTDWNIGSDGRIDISRAADFTANVSYGEYHEALSSPNTVGFQLTPNRDNKTHADATARYQPNRLGLSIGGSYDRYDWLNTPKIGGGFLFNTDRNESEYQGFARVTYDFSPGYSGFVRALYDSRQFDQFLDRTGVHRSSNGYRVDAGVTLQLTHLLSGEFYAGYLTQSYAAPLKSIAGLDYGINLDWFASPVLTVHLKGAHTISDSTLGGVSASDDRAIALSADYELRRNIMLQGSVSYTQSTLTGSTRRDDYPTAGIGVKYLMNRYLSASVNYNYSDRSSNFPGSNYTDNMISIGLSAHI